MCKNVCGMTYNNNNNKVYESMDSSLKKGQVASTTTKWKRSYVDYLKQTTWTKFSRTQINTRTKEMQPKQNESERRGRRIIYEPQRFADKELK